MRLIDADALKEQFEESHQFYIFAWGGDFSKMPIQYKAACDELVNCIAEVVNAPTIDAVPLEQYQSMEATCVKLQKAITDTPQVVRCKDCRYYQDNNGGYPNADCKWCKDETPDANDYCSCGERNEKAKGEY